MVGSGSIARKTALNSLSYRAVLRGWAFRPILSEGLFEARLELEAQRRALVRAERPAPARPHQINTYSGDLDDEIPF